MWAFLSASEGKFGGEKINKIIGDNENGYKPKKLREKKRIMNQFDKWKIIQLSDPIGIYLRIFIWMVENLPYQFYRRVRSRPISI